MELNQSGLDLIKAFEGFRADAYPDPASGGDPWTIGYGHTNLTGHPPVVKPGLTITKTAAEEILRADLKKYADAVRRGVNVPLNDNQFSALVSFCYNVGPGNFGKSSVLKYTNRGEFDGVPARLLLWNKAAGRVMRGLTRRRKSEGELFLKPESNMISRSELDEARDHRNQVEPHAGTPARKSTTIWTAIGSILAAGTTAASQFIISVSESLGPWPTVVLFAVILLAGVYIIRERRRHAQESGI